MPKAIKRKSVRENVKAEDRVRDYLSESTEWVESNMKTIAIAAVAALVVIGVVAGIFYGRRSSESRAAELIALGYEQYYGLYDNRALVEADRYAKAIESFTQSYEKKAAPLPLLFTGYAYYELGRYDDARKSFEDLLARHTADEMFVPLALYKLAMVELKAGNPEEALKRLDQLYGGSSASYRDLALIESARTLEGLGRTEESLAKYEKVISDHPKSPFLDEAMTKTGREKEEAEDAVQEGAQEFPGK